MLTTQFVSSETVLTLIFYQNIFYDKMDLRDFYFCATITLRYHAKKIDDLFKFEKSFVIFYTDLCFTL